MIKFKKTIIFLTLLLSVPANGLHAVASSPAAKKPNILKEYWESVKKSAAAIKEKIEKINFAPYVGAFALVAIVVALRNKQDPSKKPVVIEEPALTPVEGSIGNNALMMANCCVCNKEIEDGLLEPGSGRRIINHCTFDHQIQGDMYEQHSVHKSCLERVGLIKERKKDHMTWAICGIEKLPCPHPSCRSYSAVDDRKGLFSQEDSQDYTFPRGRIKNRYENLKNGKDYELREAKDRLRVKKHNLSSLISKKKSAKWDERHRVNQKRWAAIFDGPEYNAFKREEERLEAEEKALGKLDDKLDYRAVDSDRGDQLIEEVLAALSAYPDIVDAYRQERAALQAEVDRLAKEHELLEVRMNELRGMWQTPLIK